MNDQLKKNNLTENAIGDLLKKNIYETKRPNIDHLIKRILIEKRKEKKKSAVTFLVCLLTITIATVFFLKN
tara:strand:+ start:559 stop:771 length:213 start_codon:yes stop_codon:yes gene_type:complete